MGPINASRQMARLCSRDLFSLKYNYPRKPTKTLERNKGVRQVLRGFLATVKISKKERVPISNFQRNFESRMKHCLLSSCINLGQMSDFDDICEYMQKIHDEVPEDWRTFVNNNTVLLFDLCGKKIQYYLGSHYDYKTFEEQIKPKMNILGSLARKRMGEYLKPYPESDLTSRFIRSVTRALNGNVCYVLSEALMITKRPCATLHEAKFIFRYLLEKLFNYLNEFGRGENHSIISADNHCDDYEEVAAEALKFMDDLDEKLWHADCESEYFR